MKSLRRLVVGAAFSGVVAGPVAAQDSGRDLFLRNCGACHALTAEGFGPPLGGVQEAYTEAEFLARVKDPWAQREAGNPRALALAGRYPTAMPPFAHLTDAELGALYAFVRDESLRLDLAPRDWAAETSGNPVAGDATDRLLPPVVPTTLTIELEDRVAIPRLPGRTAYKGITLVRADPREDGALFVDELMGVLYRVNAVREVDVFLDVREWFDEFISEPGVATGLGSFALHPEFGRNGVFYTTHAERFRDSPAVNSSDIPVDVPPYETPPLEWVLTEWTLDDPGALRFVGEHREVMRFVTPTTGHASQEIAFNPGSQPGSPDYGMLYIGIGDGGATNLKRPDMSGHPRTFLGAILRIDPAGANSANGAYGIPDDNPFAASGDPTVRREIWAYGFRNPHRFSWDPTEPTRMFTVDIGEANIEELNVIVPGGHYGYGVASLEGTFRLNAKGDPTIVYPTTAAELAPYRSPWGQYDHQEGQAITGGFVYRGPLEALQGKYIFTDIVNGRLFFMEVDGGMADPTIYELFISRDGKLTTVKALAGADRAHVRLGYDERTHDLLLTTKDDGMIRRVSAAYHRATNID